VDEDNRRILADHPWGELAPRDEVAKAVWRTAKAYLTAAHLGPGIRTAFPALAEALAERGWDLARDRLPVRPAAHFAMGGIVTDLWGATGVPGLWAVGEVAASGVHGANRLASNSLLEGRVFGLRVAEAVLGAEGASSDKCRLAFAPPDPAFWIPTSVARQTLDQALGVIRTQTTLEEAQNYPWHAMDHLSDWLTGLMLEAAVKRQESRGAHCRDDYPATDDRWRGHLVHQKGHPLKLVPVGE
jgi:L-aspartate oxidase